MTNTKESTIKVVRDERGRFVKPIPTPRPFKVGDVVRLLPTFNHNFYGDGPSNPRGGIGKIIKDYGPGCNIRAFMVKWNTGKLNSYHANELELVPNAPKQRKAEKKVIDRPFKVGDRVTGKSNIGTNVTGTIQTDDGTPIPGHNQHYRVNGLWMLTSTLRVVPKKAKSFDLTIPEKIPAALQALAKVFGYKVEKA